MTFISAVIFISVSEFLFFFKNKLSLYAAYLRKRDIHMKFLEKLLIIQKNDWSFNILGTFMVLVSRVFIILTTLKELPF